MITNNVPLNIFIATSVSFFVAGALKILITYFKREKVNFKMALSTGGMPSSHTAVVAGLTTSVLMHEGFSVLFVISLFFSIIVMTDAVGVRMETGKQAKALNKMLKTKEFNERSGHTLLQVIGGLIVGVLIGTLLFFISF